MTLFNPVWNVEIDGVPVTDSVLANLTITSGRNNIYEQANAGYVNLNLLNLGQQPITVSINSSISVFLQDSTSAFVPIFGGTVTDITTEIAELGSVDYTQNVSIVALGALSRLPKILTNGVLAKAYDGTQIYSILKDALGSQWSQVPAAQTWASYNPATTWATGGIIGLGEIDRPGDYELAARSSDRTDIYSLVSALATSGLGYLYEDGSGLISYADSTHRTQYLSANGYTELTANHAIGSGLRIHTRAGDVRNALTIKYGATSSSEVSARDEASIATYGELGQIITTTLHNSGDASDQADFYLSLRAVPSANFEAITYELTNPELDDGDRDSLINVFMGLPVQINDLPNNMGFIFLGFVEGWTFRAAYNQISVTLNVSPVNFSLQAVRWNGVPVTESWNTVSPLLDWAQATQVA